MNPEQLRSEINSILRQMGPVDSYPVRVPMSPWLRERVDEPTVQQVYQDILARLEQKAGCKFPRHSKP
jgi:hypothetical protein